jgi:hypothetical protein
MPLSRNGTHLLIGAFFRAGEPCAQVPTHLLLCLVFVVAGLLYKIEGNRWRGLLRFPVPPSDRMPWRSAQETEMWKPIVLSLAVACLSAPAPAQTNASPDAVSRYGYRMPYAYYPPPYAYYPPAYGYFAPYLYWRPYFATTWFDPYERPYFATPWVALP